MNKLKSITVQKPDGTFSTKIPIGADAKNIDLNNGKSVQQEIDSLEQKVTISYQDVYNAVDEWMDQNFDPSQSQSVVVDDTLTVAGTAADAKKTGDEITALKEDITHIGLSDNIKVALLDVVSHIALWTDEHGQDYYDALETALYEEEYPRIIAVFNSGTTTIYTDNDLNTLKQYLVVKYKETKDSSEVIITSNDYTLSGILRDGENVIRVSYNDLSTTFIVNAVDFYNVWEWDSSNSMLSIIRNAPGAFDNIDNVKTFGIGTSLARRRAPYVLRGKVPAIDYTTKQFTEYYPIPIPNGATTVTVFCSNYPDLECGPTCWTLNEATGIYTKDSDTGWGIKAGTAVTLTSGSNFIGLNMRADASNTDFTNEPIIRVVFE